MQLLRKPTRGRLVRPFGAPPATPTSPPKHLGEDWGWVDEPYGEPIICPAAGRVRAIGHSGATYGYGMWTEVDHGNGWSTLYAHQHFRNVAVGDEVDAGDVLGGIGDSGNTTAPHLHFELRKNGVPVDPAPYYNLDGAPALDEIDPIIRRMINMKTAIVRAPNKIVVLIQPGRRHNFKDAAEYNAVRDIIAFQRSVGATDAMPLPPLDKVPGVTWEQHRLTCLYLNAPVE